MLHREPGDREGQGCDRLGPEHDLERILEDVIAEQRASVAA